MAQFVVIGIDMNAALKMAYALGYRQKAVAEMLTACESGLMAAITERLSNQR
ncbi:MAG: hypothetical protein PHS57_00940 [Alphaproteobacteria bacterium]|nr:hypothetical protein [Alphaproteobacteria bacterium]